MPDLLAETLSDGKFRLIDAPDGRFFVHIDGTTVDAPDGYYYPTVGKPFRSVPGQEVELPNDIHLPAIEEDALRPVSETEDVTIGLTENQIQKFLDANEGVDRRMLEATQLTVLAGTLFADDGDKGGMAGLELVARDRLPGRLPEGVNLPIVLTVQTKSPGGQGDTPTNFDLPAPVALPNIDRLNPGEKAILLSFNHDAGEWQAVGTATVSEDGLTLVADPGFGIRAPGWHGSLIGVLVAGPVGLGNAAVLCGEDCAHAVLWGSIGCGLGIVGIFTGVPGEFGCGLSLIQLNRSLKMNRIEEGDIFAAWRDIGDLGITGLGCLGAFTPGVGAAISCANAALSIALDCIPCNRENRPENDLLNFEAHLSILESVEPYYEILLGQQSGRESSAWTAAIQESRQLWCRPYSTKLSRRWIPVRKAAAGLGRPRLT